MANFFNKLKKDLNKASGNKKSNMSTSDGKSLDSRGNKHDTFKQAVKSNEKIRNENKATSLGGNRNNKSTPLKNSIDNDKKQSNSRRSNSRKRTFSSNNSSSSVSKSTSTNSSNNSNVLTKSVNNAYNKVLSNKQVNKGVNFDKSKVYNNKISSNIKDEKSNQNNTRSSNFVNSRIFRSSSNNANVSNQNSKHTDRFENKRNNRTNFNNNLHININQSNQQQRTISDEERRVGHEQGNVDRVYLATPQTLQEAKPQKQTLYSKNEDKIQELKSISLSERSSLDQAKIQLRSLGSVGLGVWENIKDSWNGLKYGVTNYDKVIVGATESVIDGVRDPKKAEQNFRNSAAEFGAKLYQGDGKAISQVAMEIVGAKTGGSIVGSNKVAAKFNNKLKVVGKTLDKVEDYIHPQSLKGNSFPHVKSSDDIIKAIDKVDNKVITASPSKLSGDVAGHSRKSALGLEDPGIYVAPKGQGNKYFLRSGSSDITKTTLNPKKIFESMKDQWKTPTITEFNTQGVAKIPNKVLKKGGFDDVAKYHEQVLAGKGKVVLTKRGQIGKGEIKATINPKTRKFDLGTTEIEAVIPKGQKYIDKGAKKYIKVDGEPVLIREADLVVDQIDEFVKLPDGSVAKVKKKFGIDEIKVLPDGSVAKVKKKTKVKTAEDILSSSSKSSNVKYTPPKIPSMKKVFSVQSNIMKSERDIMKMVSSRSQPKINYKVPKIPSGLMPNSNVKGSSKNILDGFKVDIPDPYKYKSTSSGGSSKGSSGGSSYSNINIPKVNIPKTPKNKNKRISGNPSNDPILKHINKINKQIQKMNYAGSLTGLVQGKTTRKAKTKLTGLEVRPILIKTKKGGRK